MGSSILTNTSAMTALRVLNQTNSNLEKTQNRISTGLAVSSSKDNASFWAVSSLMKSDVAVFGAINKGLSLAQGALGTARTGAEGISQAITDIKSAVTSAQAGAIDKKKLQADVDNALKSIEGFVNDANFNGVNLLNSDQQMRVLSSVGRNSEGVDAGYITFTAENLSFGPNGGLSMIGDISVLDRGEGIVKNQSDGVAETVLGTMAANAVKGESIEIKYQDAEGNDRTFKYTFKADHAVGNDGAFALVDEMNADKDFAKLFSVRYDTTDGFMLRAASRDSGIVLGKSATAIGNDVTDSAGAMLGGAIADLTTQRQDMSITFQDAPLRIGEEITLNFAIAGTKQEVVLRVAGDDTATGTRLDDKTNPNRVVLALDARTVAWSGTTGSSIATEVSEALDSLAGANNYSVDNSADGYTFLGAAAGAAVNQYAVDGTNGAKLNFTDDATTAGNTWLAATLPTTDYDALLDALEVAQNAAIDAAATLGSSQSRIETQSTFIKSMIDNLNTGVGTLVDADMSEESARLQALQVQQQLGIQSLSMANQAPQALLSLFR